MKHYNVAMVLLKQGNKYHLQLRSGKNQSGYIGFVGCFGGAIEPDEKPEVAACRELAEETNIILQPNELKLLGEVNVMSEKHNKPITVHAHLFLAKQKVNKTVKAVEGELISWTWANIQANLNKLTPAFKACATTLKIDGV